MLHDSLSRTVHIWAHHGQSLSFPLAQSQWHFQTNKGSWLLHFFQFWNQKSHICMKGMNHHNVCNTPLKLCPMRHSQVKNITIHKEHEPIIMMKSKTSIFIRSMTQSSWWSPAWRQPALCLLHLIKCAKNGSKHCTVNHWNLICYQQAQMSQLCP